MQEGGGRDSCWASLLRDFLSRPVACDGSSESLQGPALLQFLHFIRVAY